ncbi:DUF4767 domain-containing protein [Lactiplantibacillus garii]|uniref:DUF4767 domain-containing protein n=1 Tax=Lactiplantibacillus garii TaxID=2306423 RepID=A0A3R8J7S2_9LACO|nr:DUF4767 domain-containing protein [Lactiplantibacillus garii]RRK10752.1 DUF4767 domain-containing protein [Lactiplantibacillus garii]
MRKGIIVAVSVLAGLLAACGNQGANGQSSSRSSKSEARHSAMKVTKQSSAKQTTGTKTTASSGSRTATATWDQKKSDQLATFMVTWGKTMKQSYDSYGPGNNTNFYGLKYPAELKKNNLVADDHDATFAWSPSGTGSADYEVVGIYSDSENTDNMSAHLYLFTIHDGSPVVLITQQNQGNEENKVYFKTTANSDLRDGFSKIVAGQGTSVVSDRAKSTTPQPYNVSAAWQGDWYAVDDQGKLSQLTFTEHGMVSSYDGEKPYQSTWYLNDGSDPDDRANVHNHWDRIEKTPIKKDGTTLVNVRGWNQSAGAGAYYGIKQEKVDGKPVTVLISAGGAGAWCDATYYRTKAMAKQQTTTQFDDIDYDAD